MIRIKADLEGKQFKKNFIIKMNQLQKIQKEYTTELTNLFRTLIKKVDGFDSLQATFNWISAVIIGNKNKVKEGMRLQQVDKKLQNVSSDALILNAYDVMLELSKRIVSKQDETYLKVDIDFLNFPGVFA